MKARTQQEFAKRFVGIVLVKTGENVAQFTSIDSYKDGKTGKDVKKLFPNETDTLKVKIADLPKEARRVIKPNDKAGKQFRVRLNEDGDGVEAVQPVSGMFTVKLVELGPHKKDQPPVPYVKTFSKEGKDNSHLEFYASYEVTDGAFKGVILPAYNMHYKFEQSEEEDGMTQFDTVDNPQASQLHKLQDWAAVHGNILETPIAWNTDDVDGVDNAVLEAYAEKHKCEFANILPELQERALEADREVNVIIEKGYIKSVQEIVDYEDFSGDESGGSEEETPDTDSDFDDIDAKFPAKEVVAAEPVVVAKKATAKPATKKLTRKHEDEEL